MACRIIYNAALVGEPRNKHAPNARRNGGSRAEIGLHDLVVAHDRCGFPRADGRAFVQHDDPVDDIDQDLHDMFDDDDRDSHRANFL